MIPSNISSMSSVKAKVDIYNGVTLVKSCTCSDVLENFKISRAGDTSKFFGFGIVHKIDVNFIDLDRELTVTKEHTLKVGFVVDDTTLYPYPPFYIAEVNRDEKTNTITCTAYDGLYRVVTGDYDSLNINPPYTVKGLAEACARSLGYVSVCPSLSDGSFDVLHTERPNYEGTELIPDILVDIAEVTQTIYYLDANEQLIFKRLDKAGEPVFTIDKDKYYELQTMTACKLDNICSTNELGDNLGDTSGIVQYVRDNPLWVLREDRATLVDKATAAVKDFTITQFNCDWEGNFLLEIGDKIALTTQNNDIVSAYLLNDTIEYNGALSEVTAWEYTADDGETASNPTNLGDKIHQTYAKVDKVNKQVDLLVSDVTATKESVASLTMTTNSINLQVTEHQKQIDAFKEIETGQITDRMAQIELALDGVTTLVSENTTKVDNVVASNEEITNELSALQVADVTLNESITANTNRIGSIEVDVNSVKTTVSNQSTKISNLESADNTLQGSITANSSAIGQLEVTTNAISASVSQANDKITTLTNTTNGLTTTTEEHTNQIGSLQVTTSGINATVSNHTSQIQSTNNELAGVKTTTSNNTSKISSIETNLNGINLTVSNQGSTISSLETTTQTQGNEISELSETTETHTNQISSINTSLDSINLSVSNQSSQISTLQTTTTNQGNSINTLNGQVSANTSNISTLTTTTSTHTSEIAALKLEDNNIKASVSSVTSELNTTKTTVNTLSGDVDTLETTTATHTTQIGDLEIAKDNILLSVSSLEETTTTANGILEEQIETLTKEVDTKITADDVTIAIKEELSNGVDSVETTTGYTFDKDGLTIEKSGKEMKTQITEDGMTVYKDDTAVLTADNTGVEAKNLSASTYLVIGANSRFEDYATNRTACFWIGD